MFKTHSANSISFKGQTNLNHAEPAMETEKAKTNRKISLTVYCKETQVRGLPSKISFKLYTINSNFLQLISNLWATRAHACSHPHINIYVHCTHNTTVMMYNLVLFIHVILLMHDQYLALFFYFHDLHYILDWATYWRTGVYSGCKYKSSMCTIFSYTVYAHTVQMPSSV